MDAADVVVAAGDADLVRLEQHVGVREPVRRLEPVRGELDQQPERVLEVDRVHEPAVLDAAVADPALIEPLDRLVEGRLRDREREVVDAARVGRGPARVGDPVLVGEHRDQASVARIEVEVALGRVVEIGLLEHERHPEHALPEVDRRLAVGADERDVVDALALKLPHCCHLSTQFRLVLTAAQASPRDQLDPRLDDQRAAQPGTDRIGERRRRRRALGELDADRERRVLLDAGRLGTNEDVAADGRERSR